MGKELNSAYRTSCQITKEILDTLRDMKKFNETYEDVIKRLIRGEKKK